ncbi:ALO1 [[Candida] subhashii]|uniref:D-arabinono-1,4-lactone oxidase n=1 Tax=[Candida] subhashii TaxID=561895 RepID=A0A8J5QMM4_9ASCO|nr:ALO1 [[Candida] subhashii]KAG7663067.1 ALO1 [[Candida] subhashii]
MTSAIPESLQSFVTNKFIHSTWAGTFYCKPQAIFQPTNLEEIKELINQARLNNKTIMTIGSGHSPSDLTMTKEWLCNLDNFNQIINQQEFYGPCINNPSEKEVKFVDLTVEAGCRIYELNEYLKKHQLAIQNLGSISEQSIAGLISTGSHGSTQYHSLLSQQVVSISFLNSSGKLINCSSIENPHYFKAILLSLGKIGIITHVTLRTRPKFTIKSKQEIINFNTLISNWDNIWLDSEFIRIWWFPYSDKCICWRGNKSDEPLSSPRPSWYGTKFGRFFYESLLWISVHLWPRLTPLVERFVFNQQYGKVETLGQGQIAVQDSVEGLNMDCLFSQFVNEWSAPLIHGPEILSKLKSSIVAASKSGQFFVHAPIEVRCSNMTVSNSAFINDEGNPSLYPPQSWLATKDRLTAGPIPGNNLRPYLDNSPVLPYIETDQPTNEALSLFINATMYRPFRTNVETHEWFKIFEETLADVGGKPHWAKNFIGTKAVEGGDLEEQLGYGGKEFYSMSGFDMRGWFGEDLVSFNKVRRETDPHGVFLSGKGWLERNGLLLEDV